ncbi:hypothetical protein [Humibacter sp.]|uniref:hypothetical protein n=1 Tax=Humibacter sp. TaxID=1940291 RepID=UPI003F7E8A18
MTKAERKKRDRAIERELLVIHRTFRVARLVGDWRSTYAQQAWSRTLNTWVREQVSCYAAA